MCEVSKETDWTAKRIHKRSKMLLEFMENRWQFSFTDEQMNKLIYVSIAVDGRETPSTLPEEKDEPETSGVSDGVKTVTVNADTQLGTQQMKFWTRFVEYCNNEGRADDITLRKPAPQNWYDIPVSDADFMLEFTLTYGKYLSLVIYAFDGNAFSRLEGKKSEIESVFGGKFDWYSSKKGSTAKRIVYKHECEIFNPNKQLELFAWMIDKFDELCNALVKVGELDEEEQSTEKFGTLKDYLKSCNKAETELTFAEIESIIGTELCKSAYTYAAYWQPSPTHTMPNTILAAGYKIASVDLIGKRIVLEKQHNLDK